MNRAGAVASGGGARSPVRFSCMAATRATRDDLDWMVDLLSDRRASLAGLAPVFWRPAPDAAAKHRAFLEHLLVDGGAHVYKTRDAVLIASPRGEGWLVDDAHVVDERWNDTTDGRDLWSAFVADCEGSSVRFVCPTYERERAQFASHVGLALHESWWLKELPSAGGEPGLRIDLPGADAVTVEAPAIYAPSGPILFLPNVIDAGAAVAVALTKAPDLGCAAVVVNQAAADVALGSELELAGLRRHCEFYVGDVA